LDGTLWRAEDRAGRASAALPGEGLFALNIPPRVISRDLSSGKVRVRRLPIGLLHVGNRLLHAGNRSLHAGNRSLRVGRRSLRMGYCSLRMGNRFLRVGNRFLRVGNQWLRVGNPFLRIGRRSLHAFSPVNRDPEAATGYRGMSSGSSDPFTHPSTDSSIHIPRLPSTAKPPATKTKAKKKNQKSTGEDGAERCPWRPLASRPIWRS
jgi:hypothetical protein